MSEHKLSILVEAIGTAKAAKNLKGLDATISRIGARGGQGIRTAGRNIARMGAAAIAAGAAITAFSIKSGLESLAEREDVISATAGAIKTTGNAADVSAAQVRAWSEALESATGAAVDDKAIQAGANTLLRFGAVSGDTFKRALDAAVDLGAGMKTGPEAGAKLLGKALADPVKGLTALRKAGIVLTASETKRIKALMKANKLTEAQAALLGAVEKRYKGAAAASQGPYSRALATAADATEDAQMALAEGFLPVIERAANWLRTKLADPATIKGIRNLGNSLAGAFDKAMTFAEGVDWKSIGDGLKVAADWAKKLFDAFMSLPPEVKGTIIALGGLNKLTGGAVSGIVGELGKGLIKGVLGITAGLVNINAAAVKGGGGLPDKGTPGTSGGKPGGKPGMPSTGPAKGNLPGVVGLIVASSVVVQGDTVKGAPGGAVTDSQLLADLKKMLAQGRGDELIAVNETVVQGIARLEAAGVSTGVATRKTLETLKAEQKATAAAVRISGIAGSVASALGAAKVAAAINAKNLSVTIPVSLTSVVSVRDITVRQRTYQTYHPGQATAI